MHARTSANLSTIDDPAQPTVVDAPEFATLCEAFQWTVARVPDRPALRQYETGREVTWREFDARVRRIAAGLAALGVARGDTVALLFTNRVEALLVDVAAMHLGATPFSIYATASPEQIDYVIGNADARVLVTEAAFTPVVETLGATPEHVFVVDGEASLESLEAAGDAGFDFDAAWRAIAPGDIAVLIYTSGTTGPPKGVQLTHDNLLAQLYAASELVEQAYDVELVSYLPLAHLADRVGALYPAMLSGSTITSVRDPRTILEALPVIRPWTFFSVPRMWEKLKAGIEASAGSAVLDADDATKAAIRQRLGLDGARYLISGSAPISPEILTFFKALGLTIIEGWGLTEAGAGGAMNPPGDVRVGTVGKVIPGMEIKLADDGEILLRGRQVMVGYRNDPAKTAEAIDADGWLHTGDIGTIDEDRYIRIIDRKKELIINAAGKNMSPSNIENRVKSETWLVGSIIAIGDRRPYITALVTLDPDIAAAFQGDPDSEISAAIERANQRLSRVEQIKRFKILPDPWLPGTDELTPTMKLRRKSITEKYAAEIDALYS
jgi:long-subunit acyl-CoA synthetase (AMP-forming)